MTPNVCHFGLIADYASRSRTFSLGDGVHFNDLGNYKLWCSDKGAVFVPDDGPMINCSGETASYGCHRWRCNVNLLTLKSDKMASLGCAVTK